MREGGVVCPAFQLIGSVGLHCLAVDQVCQRDTGAQAYHNLVFTEVHFRINRDVIGRNILILVWRADRETIPKPTSVDRIVCTLLFILVTLCG